MSYPVPPTTAELLDQLSHYEPGDLADFADRMRAKLPAGDPLVWLLDEAVIAARRARLTALPGGAE